MRIRRANCFSKSSCWRFRRGHRSRTRGGLSRFLVAFLNTGQNRLFVDLSADWRVLAFTAGLACFTSVLFGLTPALRATRTEPGAAMKASGRGLTTNRERFGLRRVLVVSQVALSLVLLVG